MPRDRMFRVSWWIVRTLFPRVVSWLRRHSYANGRESLEFEGEIDDLDCRAVRIMELREEEQPRKVEIVEKKGSIA